jgi:hypothetical protein
MKARSLVLFLVAAVLVILSAGPALAHVERPGYWPNPSVDRSVKGGTGGKVPKARSLASALNKRAVGDTRVVCRRNSLTLLNRSIAQALKNGYEIRPSDKRKLSATQAKRLKTINRQLFAMCKFRELQKAVTASRNNDRVIVMPGLYIEPTARRARTHDPKCNKYRVDGDKPGTENEALSYSYQYHCPNDQNLIAVMGRKLAKKPPPSPPRENRHGIPDAGPCIRCNLQIEGSGVNADDVIIEAGDARKGDGGPNGAGSRKDVGIRADRADGFVLKNVKVRHAKEHGIYVLESDGYLLTEFKAYYNGLYGTLAFVEDHGVQEHCDGVGHGDSAVYPGGAVETGQQRPKGTPFRYNQEVRFCDLHHNMAGWSGTNGNAIHVHHNNIYDNALGFSTDVVTAAGHPGYPGDSLLIEKNVFRSNNFNVYAPGSNVKPAFPYPVGTALWIAGGNYHQVRDNWIYDNWRRGSMLFSVPDFLVCGNGPKDNHQPGCDPNGQTTSFYNTYTANHMGVRPDGTADPNGTDFWWDPWPNTIGNCWYGNSTAVGAAITQSPASPPLPDCNGGKNPEQSVGYGDNNQTNELLSCLAAFETRTFDPNGTCPWFVTPPEPQPGQSAPAARAAVFASPFQAEQPMRSDGAIDRRADLSGVTCTQWLYAGDAGRDWLVKRIRAFAGGTVNDGESDIGTGATISDEQAAQVFNGWCQKDYAQGFVLYKLYTFAAVLSSR